jgi:hypothetical protein
VQVSFEPEAMEGPFFTFGNLCIDICFFLDILITFRTAYIDDFGEEITSPSEIAFNYLKA